MPRLTIDKVRTRAQLAPRREPYWGAPLARGLFVGFRKLDDSGTWIARWRDDEGRQRYQSLGRVEHMDHTQAVAATLAWAKGRAEGIDNGDIVTVADVCAAYVKDRRREKGDANADAAAGFYRCHVLSHSLAAVPLAKLRSAHLKDWRAGLVRRQKSGAPLADGSKDHILAALKSALNYGVAERLISADRALEWKRLANLGGHARRELYLSREQRAALVAAAPAPAQPFLRALCLLPLRPGALAACTVRSLDARQESLHIGHDKANGYRSIPLSPTAFALCTAEAKDKLPSAPLFADPKGAAWNLHSWKYAVILARKAAALPADTCAYTLRHSVITDLITSGMDTLTVARLAGTSLRQIDKHYGKLIQDHARQGLINAAL